jgi:integrase
MVKLKNVQNVGGRLYYRRTRTVDGQRKTERIKLPLYDDPGFDAAYRKASGDRSPTAAPKGSMAELVVLYRQSQEYRALAPETKATRDRYLGIIEDKYGEYDYATMTPGKAKRLRNEYAETPGASRNLMSALSVLYRHAIDLELIDRNPIRGIDRLKLGEHEPWPQAVLERAMDAASPMLRLAIALHLFTGQRISDVCRMEWSHVQDDVIEVRQAKTGKTVWVPMHARLREELAKVPRHVRWLVYNTNGDQMRKGSLRERLAVVWRQIGAHYTWHGLRKNAVNALLEAGCSTAEVSAITGQSLQVVEHYARGRDERALARAAMAKWESGTDRATPEKPSGKTVIIHRDRKP